MFCKYCGTQVPDGYVCGCPASQREAQAAAAAYQQPAPQPTPTPAAPQYAPQPAPAQAAPQYAPQQPQYAPQQPQYAPQQPQYQYPPQQPQYQYPPQQPQYQYPPQPQKPAGPSFGQKLGETFKAMPNTLKGYMGNTFGACNDWITSTIFAIGGLLLHILAWLCFAAILPNTVKSIAMESVAGMGDFAAAAKSQINDMIGELFGGIYGTGVLLGFVTYILQAGIRFLIPVCGQLIRKEKIDYIHSYGVAASVSILPAAIVFVAGLLSLLSFGLGMFFAVAAMILCIVIDYKLVAKQMKNTTALVNSLILVGILTVIFVLVAFIASSIIMGYFESAFGIDLGSLGEELMDSLR